ncbi:MAG: hypothetical protein R3C56_09460 [Pirellulaceae bacterium]
MLPALSTPTLVITGEEDTIAPPAATRKWAAVIPNSQCHVLAGALTSRRSNSHSNSIN